MSKKKLKRVYPNEVTPFVADFGPIENWRRPHWETIALHFANVIRILKWKQRKLRVREVDPVRIEQIAEQKIRKSRQAWAIAAANKKHKSNRERKAALLREYLAKSWPSVVAAAAVLGPKYSFSPVTVDHWIRAHRKKTR